MGVSATPQLTIKIIIKMTLIAVLTFDHVVINQSKSIAFYAAPLFRRGFLYSTSASNSGEPRKPPRS
jgi:hypothetical protein